MSAANVASVTTRSGVGAGKRQFVTSGKSPASCERGTQGWLAFGTQRDLSKEQTI